MAHGILMPTSMLTIDGMERRMNTSAILWNGVESSQDGTVAAGSTPAVAPVAITERAPPLLCVPWMYVLDRVGFCPREPVYSNISASTLFQVADSGARACF